MLTTRNPIKLGDPMQQIFHRLLSVIDICLDCGKRVYPQGYITLRAYDKFVYSVDQFGPETQYYTISLEACLKSTPDLSSNPKPSQRQEPGYGTVDLSIILNFGTLNKLAKDGLARGIPRLKFHKDHLCV
ncbi:hypothetical protein Tco_0895062 [Tanacetum coccineum]|uniref:Uncharacterized protein n=1 Tax=Tanacetum coccineum TaxID=301880 RepID=A0ABQ5CDJ8_9ASTR